MGGSGQYAWGGFGSARRLPRPSLELLRRHRAGGGRGACAWRPALLPRRCLGRKGLYAWSGQQGGAHPSWPGLLPAAACRRCVDGAGRLQGQARPAVRAIRLLRNLRRLPEIDAPGAGGHRRVRVHLNADRAERLLRRGRCDPGPGRRHRTWRGAGSCRRGRWIARTARWPTRKTTFWWRCAVPFDGGACSPLRSVTTGTDYGRCAVVTGRSHAAGAWTKCPRRGAARRPENDFVNRGERMPSWGC